MNNLEKTYNEEIEELSKQGDLNTDNISDGYHTFGELYKHRIHLFIALCKQIESENNNDNYRPVKSQKHYDGSQWEGWFIMQLETRVGQISYHLPNEYWNKCGFAKTLDRANKWDGHTSDDVLDRLLLI